MANKVTTLDLFNRTVLGDGSHHLLFWFTKHAHQVDIKEKTSGILSALTLTNDVFDNGCLAKVAVDIDQQFYTARQRLRDRCDLGFLIANICFVEQGIKREYL